MRIFLTGASGHIGSAVVPDLLSAGHDVVALARSDRSAAAAEAMGAVAHRGDLVDLDSLRTGVADADAVIHLAFDHDAVHAGDLEGATTADLEVVGAFGDALAGTDKAFIGIGIGPTGNAETDAIIDQNPRAAVAKQIAAFAPRGVRSVLVAVPPVVHSTRDQIGFMPTLIAIARRTGISGYVADGANHWPAVHTKDLARLIRLATESAPAGTQLHAAAEDDITTRQIAETIAYELDATAVSIAPEQIADHFGGFAQIMGLDFPPMTSDATRQLLDWHPEHPGLIDDLRDGQYFDTDSKDH